MGILEDRKGKEYDPFTKEYIVRTTETTTESSTESLRPLEALEESLEESLEEGIYGEKWQEIVERAVYAPTRFEYFTGLALQGLITGRAERDLKTAVRKALDLAREVEELLDKKED